MSFRNGTVLAMAQQLTEQQESFASAEQSSSSFRPSLPASVNLALERVISSTGLGKSNKDNKSNKKDLNTPLLTASASSVALGSITRLHRKRFTANRGSKQAQEREHEHVHELEQSAPFREADTIRRIFYDEAELYQQPPSFLDMDEDDDTSKLRSSVSRFKLFVRSESKISLMHRRKSTSAKASLPLVNPASIAACKLATAAASEAQVAKELSVQAPIFCTMTSFTDFSHGECLCGFPEVPRRRMTVTNVSPLSIPLEVASWRKDTTPTAALSAAEKGCDESEEEHIATQSRPSSVSFVTPPRNKCTLSTTSTVLSSSPLAVTATDSTFSTPTSIILNLDVPTPIHYATPAENSPRTRCTTRRRTASRLPPPYPPPTYCVPPIPSQFL